MFGRKAVAHHLRAKYRSMRNAREASRPIARLGVVDLPKASDQPCVMVEQS